MNKAGHDTVLDCCPSDSVEQDSGTMIDSGDFMAIAVKGDSVCTNQTFPK